MESNNLNIITLKESLNLLDNINKNKFVINLFKLLSQLTNSPLLKYDDLLSIVNNLNENHYIFIYENVEKEPIGIITLLVEQKLIHGGMCVAHIEDLVVDHNYKGKGIASQLIDHCIKIAQKKTSRSKKYRKVSMVRPCLFSAKIDRLINSKRNYKRL